MPNVIRLPIKKTSTRSKRRAPTRAPMLCELRGFLEAVREAREMCPSLPRWVFVSAGRCTHDEFSWGHRVDVTVLLSWVDYVLVSAA